MYWETYAYILDGKIINIGVYEPLGAYTKANDVAHTLYGYNAFAVCVTDYPVSSGDDYIDGFFYRDGVKIEKVNTILDDVTDIQVALVELAEIIAGG